MVTIQSVSLAEVAGAKAAVNAAISGKRIALGAEMGAEAWIEGRSEGGNTFSAYVTPTGLQILKASSNALSFRPGEPDGLQRHRTQHGFGEVEAEVRKHGFADVVVRLRSESAQYDIGRDGRLKTPRSALAVDEYRTRAGRLLSRISASDVGDKGAIESRINESAIANEFEPTLLLRTNFRALVEMAHSAEVASIRLSSYIDNRATTFDGAIADVAARNGSAEVIVVLRDPSHHIALSRLEFDARHGANTRAFRSLMDDAKISEKYLNLSAAGTMVVRLTSESLNRLQATSDRRLLRVVHNRPSGTALLSTSTAEMNVIPWWNVGFSGTYPSPTPGAPPNPIKIAVFDTWIKRTHPMMASKIVYEACFGTNFYDAITDITWYSICPQAPNNIPPMVAGDTPLLNILGSGEPSPLGMSCAASSGDQNGACSHGTHVAGIAAGNTTGHTGVARDSAIVSAQVFSYDFNANKAPTWFAADLLAGLQALIQTTNPATQDNDFIVNMSLGGSTLYQSSCTSGVDPGVPAPNPPPIEAFVPLFQQLRDRGIPVVVATGNSAGAQFGLFIDGILFPACIPGVIKVSAAENTSSGNVRATYANLPKLQNFSGETWIAPGGAFTDPTSTGVESAWIASGQQFMKQSGTSSAAPHVAGLYAIVKAGFRKIGWPFTVTLASNWIVTDASFETTWTVTPLHTGIPESRTYRVVRLRNP